MAGSFAVGWRQNVICFLMLMASGMVAPTYSIVALPLAAEFQPSRMVLMFTMTVMAGSAALMAPFLGSLMDKISVRKLMMIGGTLLATGYLAISMATTFDQILIIFGLIIAPAGVLTGPVAITVLLSRWFVRRRGRAIGLAIAGVSAGGFLFPMIIQGLFEAFEWRFALQMLGIIVFLWMVPAAFFVVDRPSQRGLYPDGDPAPPEETNKEASAKPRVPVLHILTDPAFWLIAITVAIVTAGMKGMVTNLASMATDNGIDPTKAALLISIYSASSFVSKLNFALLSDRFGPRILMFISLAGFGIGMACLTQAHLGYWMIVVGIMIIGLAGGLMVPTESYLAPKVFGENAVGRAIGMLSGVIMFALLATPPLFGLIFDLTGSYQGIFWTFCGLAFTALLWLPLIRLHPRSLPGEQPIEAKAG